MEESGKKFIASDLNARSSRRRYRAFVEDYKHHIVWTKPGSSATEIPRSRRRTTRNLRLIPNHSDVPEKRFPGFAS
jgi:hypothetical protein